MRCALLDVPCHALAWVLSWPWYLQALVALGVALMLWGGIAALYRLAKSIGGWQAGLGAVIALLAAVAALWPKGKKPVPTDEIFPHPDPKPVKRKKRPTIFDGLRK